MIESTLYCHALLSHSQVQGAQAERSVKDILLRHGWRLLEHNWSCRYGEIDLLLTKHSGPNRRILVVEVKARRRSGLDGWGLAAFHHAKRRCLARSVSCWQAANPWSESSYFEVVLALVALPVQRHCVRWIRIDRLDRVSQ
ncbi:MAG: YraN family protein [Synechococcus sp. SP2 MAG]|nr:YraN family protein [Synechococcus sp. SP2 MAG]